MTRSFNDLIWSRVREDRRRGQITNLTDYPDGLAALLDGADLLDLGCGDGACFDQLLAAGARVTGADQSAVALERAGRRCPEVQTAQVGDDSRLPLADNSFDIVWCADTLEHVLDVQIALSEARRVLRPGGRLVIATPDHPLWRRLWIALVAWERWFDPMSPHLRFFTRRSLRRLLDDLGFSVVSLRARRGDLFAVARRL